MRQSLNVEENSSNGASIKKNAWMQRKTNTVVPDDQNESFSKVSQFSNFIISDKESLQTQSIVSSHVISRMKQDLKWAKQKRLYKQANLDTM